jgi:hypothetical protein
MTQIEFENQMRELRTQKGAALTAIARLQGEVKDDMEAIDRQIHELKERKAKLNQQRIALSDRRFALEQEWGKRIKDFQDANFTTTRELENISEWTLANELRKRGYSGRLVNLDKDPDFMLHLNQKLNGKEEQTD